MNHTSYKIAIIFLSATSISLLYYSVVNTDFESSHELNPERNNYYIPDWVKRNAAWWSEGYISDDEYSYALEYLIKEGVVEIEVCEGKCVVRPAVEFTEIEIDGRD